MNNDTNLMRVCNVIRLLLNLADDIEKNSLPPEGIKANAASLRHVIMHWCGECKELNFVRIMEIFLSEDARVVETPMLLAAAIARYGGYMERSGNFNDKLEKVIAQTLWNLTVITEGTQ
jgi:hypothetical protein